MKMNTFKPAALILCKKTRLSFFLLRTALFLAVAANPLLAEETNVTVRFQGKWSNVFGGQQTTLKAVIYSKTLLDGRLTWRYSAGGRTIQREESRVSAEPGKSEMLAVSLPIPEVKEGVVMRTTFQAAVQEKGEEQSVAEISKTLWVFPEKPFSNKQEWLKNMEIHLFDPEKKTSKIFGKMDIPFHAVGNVDALTSIKNGVVVIGEGISFRDYRGLAEIMLKTAASGAPVLCLSPTAGDFHLPNHQQENLPVPDRMAFAGNDIIKELDKRLDSDMWKPGVPPAVNSLELKGEKNGIAAVINDTSGQWTFVEMRFGETRLVICAWGIITNWNKGPTPRFLLDRLLNYVEKK